MLLSALANLSCPLTCKQIGFILFYLQNKSTTQRGQRIAACQEINAPLPFWGKLMKYWRKGRQIVRYNRTCYAANVRKQLNQLLFRADNSCRAECDQIGCAGKADPQYLVATLDLCLSPKMSIGMFYSSSDFDLHVSSPNLSNFNFETL